MFARYRKLTVRNRIFIINRAEMRKNMSRQNLTLLTDLYELTMMQGYFQHKDCNETVIFDAFYRSNPCGGGYAISAGLEQVIQLKNCTSTGKTSNI